MYSGLFLCQQRTQPLAAKLHWSFNLTSICVAVFVCLTLTIENNAGISHPHGVHGNASVVTVVLFRHVEKDQHWLFTLGLNPDSIQPVEEPGRQRRGRFSVSAAGQSRLASKSESSKVICIFVWHFNSIVHENSQVHQNLPCILHKYELKCDQTMCTYCCFVCFPICCFFFLCKLEVS